jgi:hypothetical protein
MGEVLLIDFATCAAVIVVAVAVMVMVRRRRRDQARAPGEQSRGPVAPPAEEGTSRRDVACVPGFSHDPRERDLGPDTPDAPELPPEQAPELAPELAPEQAPEQVPESQVTGAADPDLDSGTLSAQLEVPEAAADASTAGPSTAGPSTAGERVGAYYEGYYDEADRPVAGYLAALGWPEEQGHPVACTETDRKDREHS